MRKVIQAFCLFLCTALVTVQYAQAASPSAGSIFNSIGGNTTIDRGGALHSQARSIYSLGGGMTSFQGKKVTLLAVDPPSFNAGCNGISWHFGGFAFISLDEVRQLVESVAQASLGLAVDLAMQTLCPQCYAVMSKLRDMSNMMRNAAYDSCQIAQSLMSQVGWTPATKRSSKCAEKTTESSKTSSWLEATAGAACRQLEDAEKELGKAGKAIDDFLRGNKPPGESTPNAKEISEHTNITYQSLGALGYDDGIIKDILLSLTGMTIYPTKGVDCRETLAGLYASADSDSELAKGATAEEKASMAAILNNGSPAEIKSDTATKGATPADAKVTESTPTKTGSATGQPTCFVPPIVSGLHQSIGRLIMCGKNPVAEAELFANNYYKNLSKTPIEILKSTSLGVMCSKAMENKASMNPLVYTCRKNDSAECMAPKMVRLDSLLSAEPAKNGYTGVAWMVGDALQRGVLAVRDNTTKFPDDTLAILNGSGWPLYRLINMAAVYPSLAGELLSAYTAAIAAQYTMDTLDKVVRIGAQPGIPTKSATGLRPQDITPIREQIMVLVREGNSVKTDILTRLAEKRQMVDVIMQVNKTLQAEVISQGLSGNTALAVGLKRQAAAAKTAAANQSAAKTPTP